MPFHFQPFVGPVKPTAPGAITVIDWLSNNAGPAMQLPPPLVWAEPSIAAPDKATVYVAPSPKNPAMWTPTVGGVSRPLPQAYAKPELTEPTRLGLVYVAPDSKQLIAVRMPTVVAGHDDWYVLGDILSMPPPSGPARITLDHWLPNDAPVAMITGPQKTADIDYFADSAYPFPPGKITIDDWAQLIASNAVALYYQRPDAQTGPPKAFAAPLVAGWLANIVGPFFATFVPGDTFTSAPKTLPPAAITLDHWLQLLAANSVPQPYSQGDLLTHPDKAIPTPSTVLMSSWFREFVVNGVQNLYAKSDFTTSVIPLPFVTVASWFQEVARTALVLASVVNDLSVKPPLVPIPTAVVSIASWLAAVCSSMESSSTLGDILTSPPLTTPAAITLNHWLQYLAVNNLPQVYAQIDAQTKPVATLPTTAVAALISAWLANTAAMAIPPIYAEPDFVSSPSPLPTITTAAWLANLAVSFFGKFQPSDVAAPAKVLPTQTVESIDSWLQYLAANAMVLEYQQGDTQTAPSKTLPPAPVTIMHWLQLLAATAQPPVHALGDTLTHPDKVLPTVTVESVDSWLQYLAANAVQLTYAEPDFVGPTLPQPPATVRVSAFFQEVARAAIVLAKTMGDTFTGSPLPITAQAAVVSVASWLRDTFSSAENYNVLADIFTAPPFTSPASVTIDHWLSNDLWNAFSKYSAGDTFTHPEKIITAVAAVVSLAAWFKDVPWMEFPQTFTQSKDSPLHGTTAYIPIATIASWAQLLAANSLSQTFSQPEAQAKPAATLPTTTNLTIDSWLQYLADRIVTLAYQPGDTLTHPEKVLPPAPITIDHWLQLLAPNAQPQDFAPGSIFAAPEKTLPTVTVESIDSWLQYLAANAILLTYQAGDIFTHPDKVLPPAPVTLVHWTPTIGQNVVIEPHSPGPSYVAPEKVLPFVAAAASLAAWLANIAQSAFAEFQPSEPFTAPSKVLPPVPATIAAWLANTGVTNFLIAQPGDTMTGPAKVLPPAPITTDNWLQFPPPNAQPPTYSAGDIYTAPVATLPTTVRALIAAAFTAVGRFTADGVTVIGKRIVVHGFKAVGRFIAEKFEVK